MLRDLESYLVRRAGCGLSAKNYNRTFLGALRELKKSPSRALLRKHLLSLEGESTLWPNDERFKKAWMTAPIYLSLGPEKTRTILYAIERGLETSKTEKAPPDDALSIEHVLPQAGSVSDWP